MQETVTVLLALRKAVSTVHVVASRPEDMAEPATDGGTAPTNPVEADLYEVVTDPRALEALKAEWDALYDRAAQPYFSQSFAWCWTAWQRVSAPRGRRLHCLIGRAGGRIVLIWPFVIHRLGLWSVARPLGPETTEYSCVLVEEGPEAASRIDRAWKVLRESLDADIILLPLVRDETELCRLLAAETTPAFTETDPTSYVSRAKYENWEAYHRSLDGDLRREVRRTRRRLAEKGELIFEPSVESTQRAAVIDWILQQKGQWLSEAKRHNPWLQAPEYRDFLVAMATTTAPTGQLLVSALRLDDRIVAATLHRVDRTRLEGLLTVFDPAFRAYGPGQIILEECLKLAFAQNHDLDFRLGAESYKNEWTDGSCDVFSYEFGISRWGAFYVLYRHTAQRISRLRYRVPPTWRRKLKAALGLGRRGAH